MTRRGTTGAIERDDFDQMVPVVAERFLEMIEVVTRRLTPPAMTPAAVLPRSPRSYLTALRRLDIFARLGRKQLPLVQPVWIQHLIDTVVEQKIAVDGTPATYLLDPEPDLDDAEVTERYNQAVVEYLTDVAERFAGYSRPWIDDPIAVAMYQQVKRHTIDELRAGARVSYPHILGGLGPSHWTRWEQQAREEGMQADIEYMAQQAALHVATIRHTATSLLGLARQAVQGEPTSNELQDPETFKAAVLKQLDEALETLSGAIPEDDPLWPGARSMDEAAPYYAYPPGRRLRRIFIAAMERSGDAWNEANRKAQTLIELSSEARRMPGLTWLPILPDRGATDLDLAQRAYLWEFHVSGGDLAYDIWAQVTGDDLDEEEEREILAS